MGKITLEDIRDEYSSDKKLEKEAKWVYNNVSHDLPDSGIDESTFVKAYINDYYKNMEKVLKKINDE